MNSDPTVALSGSTGDMLSSLKSSFVEHPVPTALIGAGLVWMLTAAGGAAPRLSWGSHAERRSGSSETSAGNRDSGLFLPQARETITTMIEQQPLLLGVLGIALGAGLAATLPSTTVEANVMGEASDAVGQRAVEFARQQGQVAKKVLENVTAAVVHESSAQGLTKDELLRQANELSEKAKRVAAGAVEAAKEKLR